MTVELWELFHLEEPLVVVEQQLLDQIIQVVTTEQQEVQVHQIQLQDQMLHTLAVVAVVVGMVVDQELVELAVVEQVEIYQMELQAQQTLVAVVEVQDHKT
jgi:hypothetical protein